jgi:hypothetical protein
LPQGQQTIVRTNVTLLITCGYIGVDSLNLPPVMFKAIAIEPTGINVPSELATPTFGQSRGSLSPEDLYLTVQQRYTRVLSDQLCDCLHVLACPQTTQDYTFAIRNIHQEGVDPSGQLF